MCIRDSSDIDKYQRVKIDYPPRNVFPGPRDLFKFSEIMDNISEMVQDSEIVTIED